jgi:aspartate racemase
MPHALNTPGIWGIVGGLGPLASAEFVKTIYERRPHDREQEHPRIILLSDPTYPDRTECLLRGEPQPLVERLRQNVDTLVALGATRLIVCCVTMHAVLPALSESLRARMLSLVDLLIERLASADGPHLMLCSSGCRAAGVLQAHPRWSAVRDRIVWPDAADQEAVHGLIYALKRGDAGHEQVRRVCRLLDRYDVPAYIAGCTELHLITRSIEAVTGRPHHELCVDPLMLAADEVAGQMVTGLTR